MILRLLRQFGIITVAQELFIIREELCSSNLDSLVNVIQHLFPHSPSHCQEVTVKVKRQMATVFTPFHLKLKLQNTYYKETLKRERFRR